MDDNSSEDKKELQDQQLSTDKPVDPEHTAQGQQSRDSYSVSGKVRPGGIVIQGPGAKVDIKQIYRELSSVEEEREQQLAELEQLKDAVKIAQNNIKDIVLSPPPDRRNPFHFIEPFNPSESKHFAGRQEVLTELLDRLDDSPVLFLGGNGGVGKTSLLQAGLIPVLVDQGHLPLLVPVTREPLDISIKKRFLPNLDAYPFIKSMSLTEFLRRICDQLKTGKYLFLLIDRFEGFFSHSEDELQRFKLEWGQCVSGIVPQAFWLFSIHLGFTYYLTSFFQPEINPFVHMIVLPPLSPSSAREAINSTATRAGIEIEEDLVIRILTDLGDDSIDPTHLQIVCYTMAGGNGPLVSKWTQQNYGENDRVEGILRSYLEKVIRQYPPEDREPAWLILASLEAREDGTVDEGWLVDRMATYKVNALDTNRVLDNLQFNHLVDREDGSYRLASADLIVSIRNWKEKRSALAKAREEALQQLRRTFGSAIRGLLGGAVGFALFDRLIYPQALPDFLFEIYALSVIASSGAIAGFLLAFTVDLALATYHGPRSWLRYLLGAFGGAAAFAWALTMYGNTLGTGDISVTLMLFGALEGTLWGLITGPLAVWILASPRPVWQTIPVAVIISGVSLGIIDQIGHIFGPLSPLIIILAGSVFIAFVMISIILGRRSILTGG